ncbi:MAG: ATP-dependent metalloprotease, partial [Bacteroidetes bacterium]|nr:ATP-dependent metalloprotease [Bacteroidota bacterium]
YDDEDNEPFLGRSMSRPAHGQSDQTAREIDAEVKLILTSCYDRAKQILVDNMDKLHLMADALLEYETIDAKQIDDIMLGKKPRAPEGWDDRNKPAGGESADDLVEADDERSDSGTASDGPATQH